jgi:phosphate acetyltransferase/phosphate butyryltransferase
MDFIENRTFDEINVGDSASLIKTLTYDEIRLFAVMSGDVNPAMVDEAAQSDDIHQLVGRAMWGGSLISHILGRQLPCSSNMA